MTGIGSVPLLSVAIGAALVVGVLAVAYFAVGRQRKPLDFVRRLGRLPTQAVVRPTFIGREREADQFRRLLKRTADTPPVLLVTGIGGVGKRALLYRFRDICLAERHPAQAGPVIDLNEALSVDQILESIASDLINRQPGEFKAFGSALYRYRQAAKGAKPGSQQVLELSRGMIRTLSAVAPLSPAQGAEKVLGSELADKAASLLAGASDLDSLMYAFVTGLLKVADGDRTQRLVLFFADLDSRPEDRDVVLFRTVLLPMIAPRPSLLLVLSAENQQRASLPLAFGQPSVMALPRFTIDESRRFAREVIGITNPTLVEQVAADSDGILDRLDGYRLYFQQDPESRGSPSLPEAAKAWAAGGSVYDLLQQVSSPFLQRVILYSSPLRWFNAPLLDEVAKVTQLKPDSKDGARIASDLLDRGRRPSWITNVGGGWGIDGESRRRAFLNEFRRRSPSQYLAVHVAAAQYHRRVLETWGGTLPRASGVITNAGSIEVPPPPIGWHVFEDSEYVATLAEYLYHILAQKPREAFPLAVETAVKATFQDCKDATRLIDVGPEISNTLDRSQRLYLGLLSRAIQLYGDSNYSEAPRVLKELFQAGAPTSLVRAAVQGLLGIVYSNLWEEQAIDWLRAATNGLEQALEANSYSAQIGSGDIAFMLCITYQWLAYVVVTQDEVEKDAMKHIDIAFTLAKQFQISELQAGVTRTKGLIFEQVQDIGAARKEYEAALGIFESIGEADSIAGVQRDLARLLTIQTDYVAAARRLDDAAGIYSYLADTEHQWQVAIEQMRLDLARQKFDEAAEQRDKALRLSAGDASIYEAIGRAYLDSGAWIEAVPWYEKAIDMAPLVPKYHLQIAMSLSLQGRNDDAAVHYDKALELTQDPAVALEVALFRRSAHKSGAGELFAQVRRQRQAAVRANPKGPSPMARLGDLWMRWSQGAEAFEREEALTEAERAYRKALEIAGSGAAFHARLGRCLVEKGQVEDALEQLWIAEAEAPGKYGVRDSIVGAITKLAPGQSQPFIQRAWSSWKSVDGLQKRLRKALDQEVDANAPEWREVFVALLSEFPADANLHYLYARALTGPQERPALTRSWFQPNLSEGEGSRPEFETAGSAPPVQPSAIEWDREAIVSELRKAQNADAAGELTGEVLDCLLTLARRSLLESHWGDALRFAEEALRVDPDNNEAETITSNAQRPQAWARLVHDPMPAVVPVSVAVAQDLLVWVETPANLALYTEMFPAMRQELTSRLGIFFPGVNVRTNYGLEASTVEISLFDVPRYRVKILPRLMAGASPRKCRTRARIYGRATRRPWDAGVATLVQQEDVPALLEAGIEIWDPRGALVIVMARVLQRHAAMFVGTEEVAVAMSQGGIDADKLLRRLPDIARNMRQKLQAGIPVSVRHELDSSSTVTTSDASISKQAVGSRATGR